MSEPDPKPVLSPRGPFEYFEYAVEAGGSVLGHRRYETPEDAYFWGVLLKNNIDRERCGRILVNRRVVRRKVVFEDWERVDKNEIDL